MADYIDIGKLRMAMIRAEDIRRVEIVPLGRMTMGQWYDQQADKPRYMINASLWDVRGSIGTIYIDGALQRNEGNGFGFGTQDGRTFAFGTPWDRKWCDYITGYPGLIRDGKAVDGVVTKDVRVGVTRRAAVAEKDDRLFLVTGKALTLDGFRRELLNFGFENAINLDGGGSARLMIDGKAVNDPTDDRACKLAIAVWTKTQKEEKSVHKVFLGVGHGGKDPGAVSGGLKEKDITLGIAMACRDELAKHGVLTKMSRSADEDDPLSDEIRECNTLDPDLALDIHINAGGGRGFEAYHTLTGGRGKELAENIEAEVTLLGHVSRGCKTRKGSTGRDYYGFIRETKCPAVIAEFGFIDNAADRAWFDTPEKQDAIGRAYARGILITLGVDVHAEQQDDCDIPAGWAKDAWDKATKAGVMDGTRPTEPVTRQELAVILNRLGVIK